MASLNQVHYYIMYVSAFAKDKKINQAAAFNYLDQYKGIEFLVDCYEAEHTLSIDNAVEDLTIVCKNNGGTIE